MTNEEMSMKTKLALANALKAAMKTKKLSKITVSELICACDINRKTFYYHFQDIYDLLKWTLERETLDVVKNFDLIINTEEAIRFLMDYTEKNNYIVNGAFDSMGYEELKRFFHNDLFSVIYGAIENGEGKLHVQLEPQFKQFLAEFYTEASAAMLIEWTKNRVSQEKETVIQNIVSIFKISLPAIVKEKSIPIK